MKKKIRGRKKKEKGKKRKRGEKTKRQKLKNLQRKRKSMVIMVMINLNQAKLMNDENLVEIETTEMRKNVKKKDKEENWRIEGEDIAGSEMEETREEEWKAATRGNVKEYWGNHHNSVIGIWRGWKEWGRKRNEKWGKRDRNSGKGRATDDKFKWTQASNEWGKLIWNNQNEEEFEETDE